MANPAPPVKIRIKPMTSLGNSRKYLPSINPPEPRVGLPPDPVQVGVQVCVEALNNPSILSQLLPF